MEPVEGPPAPILVVDWESSEVVLSQIEVDASVTEVARFEGEWRSQGYEMLRGPDVDQLLIYSRVPVPDAVFVDLATGSLTRTTLAELLQPNYYRSCAFRWRSDGSGVWARCLYPGYAAPLLVAIERSGEARTLIDGEAGGSYSWLRVESDRALMLWAASGTTEASWIDWDGTREPGPTVPNRYTRSIMHDGEQRLGRYDWSLDLAYFSDQDAELSCIQVVENGDPLCVPYDPAVGPPAWDRHGVAITEAAFFVAPLGEVLRWDRENGEVTSTEVYVNDPLLSAHASGILLLSERDLIDLRERRVVSLRTWTTSHQVAWRDEARR